MSDEELNLLNACTDLLSLKKCEAFPLHLLGTKRSGEWICVRNLSLQIGMSRGDLKPELFATWLPDPRGYEAYAVILFYDDESKWSMAAQYNRDRLLHVASSLSAQQPTGTTRSGSSCSTSQQAAPAVDR
jgi:hypothetical protein